MTRKYNQNNRMNKQGQSQEEENGGGGVPGGKLVQRKRPAGLVNLGNTCFMNAALQCLSRTPNLLTRLEMLTKEPTITFSGSALSYNNENQGKDEQLQFTLVIPMDSMVRRMVQLLHQMTDGSGGTVNPRNVHSVMTKNFGAGLQHDSHELLRHVLDKLKKDQIKAFRLALMKKFDIPVQEGAKLSQSDPQKANMVKEWDRKLYNTTVIDDIFGGELLTTRTCLECNAIKTSSEEFLDISLPIRFVKSGSQNNSNNNANNNNRFSAWNEVTTINRTLQECFQCFTEPEILSGNNKVDCEKCHEAKLNQLKAGVPIEQVFPPAPEEASSSNSNNKFNRQLSNQKLQKKQVQEQAGSSNSQQQQQQTGRKKKRRKTRREKMAEDPFPGENQQREKDEESRKEDRIVEKDEEEPLEEGEEAVPESEKVPDEGYSEDFKESDDSAGTSGPDMDQNNEEEEEEDEDVNEDDEVEQVTPPKEKKIEVPKSTKTSCRRQTMIYKPPQNLTIHLKRFTVSTRGFAQKLVDHVKFTEYINIREYVTSNLPSVEDGNHHEKTRTISTSSWCFEELVPKETDMLGGASGDSHEFRHSREGEPGDRIIEPPASISIPIKLISSSVPSAPPQTADESRVEDEANRNEAATSKGEEIEEEEEESVQEKPSLMEQDDDFSVVPQTVEDCLPGGDEGIEGGNPNALANQERMVISPSQPLSDSEPHQSDNRPEETCPDADKSVQGPSKLFQESNFNNNNIDSNTRSEVDIPSTVQEISEQNPEADQQQQNQQQQQDIYNNKIEVDEQQASPSHIQGGGGGGDGLLGDEDENMEDTAVLDPIGEFSYDDEPPPYPGSPIPDDENDLPREPIDVTLPDDGSSNWREYKNNDIVQWSFKSEDNPDESSEPGIFSGPAIPLPPPPPALPAVDFWTSQQQQHQQQQQEKLQKSNIQPEEEDDDTSKIVIPLGYSSLDDLEETSKDEPTTIFGPFLEDTAMTSPEEILPEETVDDGFITDPDGINYRLCGIVEHGGSLNWGHYVAYIRVNSDWFYVSDSYVSHSDISTVLSRDPYILFYERVP